MRERVVGRRRLCGWQFCLLAFVAWVLVLLTGVQASVERPQKRLVELGLAILLLAAFVTHPATVRARKGVGLLGRAASLVWPATILLVDAANPRHLMLYPLASWHMFSAGVGGREPPVQIRYVARFRDGTEARLIPGGVVSDVVTSSLDGKLREMLERAASGGPPERARAELAIRTVARLTESAEPEREIVAVIVQRWRMPVKPPFVPLLAESKEVRVR